MGPEDTGENMGVSMSRIIGSVREVAGSMPEMMHPARIRGYGRTVDPYNRAISNVLRHEEVRVRFGRGSRALAATDLTKVLRDCRQKISVEETTVSEPDRKFFSDLLVRLANTSEVQISLDDVLHLRKIAYGEKEAELPVGS